MGKPKSVSAPQTDAAAIVEIDEEILAALDGETEDDASLDAEILAAIAGTPVEDVADEPEDVVAIDPVAVSEDDAEALIASLKADEPEEDTKKPKKKSSGKSTKSAKKDDTPAAPARAFGEVAGITDAQVKSIVDGINAKKVVEKAQNLISSIETGKKLSGYTKIAVEHLIDKGEMSGKSLVEEFQAKGLSLGTARAQSQQMTALFKAFGLASESTPRGALVLQKSPLVDELVKLAA